MGPARVIVKKPLGQSGATQKALSSFVLSSCVPIPTLHRHPEWSGRESGSPHPGLRESDPGAELLHLPSQQGACQLHTERTANSLKEWELREA